MNSAILPFIILSMRHNSSWVTDATWQCVNTVATKYMMRTAFVVQSDTEIKPFIFQKPLILSSVFPRGEYFDFILIYKKIEKGHINEIYGRVVLITESLKHVDLLWSKLKIVELLVILQMQSHCKIYAWFPYDPKSCGVVHLKLEDICENGTFVDNRDLLLKRIPDKFYGCTINISFSDFVPFIKSAPNGTGTGPDFKILNALVKQLGMNYVSIHVPFKIQNSYVSKVFKFLEERTVDIAAALFLGHNNLPFNLLPSHLQDKVTWLLPGPIPKPVAFGFITALSLELWGLIGLLYLFVFCFVSLASPSNNFGYNFSWTSARFLSLPNPPLGDSCVLRGFSYLLELTILIISTIYKSLILVQLFQVPMLIISTASQGLDHGLTPYFRSIDMPLLNNTHNSLSKKILSKNYESITTGIMDYSLIFSNRSAMLLGPAIADQAMIQIMYPKINVKSAISIQKGNLMLFNFAFVVPLHYPLTEILSVKLLNVIQAGLPNLYLQQEMEKRSAEQKDNFDKSLKPLSLSHVLTIFYLFVLLQFFCSFAFIGEIVIWRKLTIINM